MGKKLDIKKLQTERSAGFISTEEALKDVTPFLWDDDIDGDEKNECEMDWGPDVGGEVLSLYDSE